MPQGILNALCDPLAICLLVQYRLKYSSLSFILTHSLSDSGCMLDLYLIVFLSNLHALLSSSVYHRNVQHHVM
jgi:hypothetical protein